MEIPQHGDTKTYHRKIKPSDFGVVVAQNYLFRTPERLKNRTTKDMQVLVSFHPTSIVYLAKLLAEKGNHSYWYFERKST
jgi:hypothetical protein